MPMVERHWGGSHALHIFYHDTQRLGHCECKVFTDSSLKKKKNVKNVQHSIEKTRDFSSTYPHRHHIEHLQELRIVRCLRKIHFKVRICET